MPPNTPPDSSTGLDLSPQPVSAQAPAQLTCSEKRHPVASPFLSSPYSGWTELVSFVDHDQPDYTVDGRIVLANGLTALASDGQESDLFPAYWSPALRQYVNYDGHNGYDFGLSYQPVLAAASGTVQYAGWNDPNPYVGYGQMVLINHHNGYVTLYGHLSKLEVSTGDKVTAGQEIGISGTTGHSSGPHLHFSVFHDCQVADPYGWTGHSTDPLSTFSGSDDAYLWLPGHDPLLLNPPPNWPTYPSGLRIAFAASAGAPSGPRAVPPADRLLLLALPSARGSSPLDSGTALARTDAAITAESQELRPQLDELKSEGLISNYQYIPSAAAFWVRGTATADQLEALPGVASLAGVQPHDVEAAQTGLAHAVLTQVGGQQAPSLWPVGFRSGVHTWRPVATVLVGHALLSGLALPGKQVVLSLRRGMEIPAAASAVTDPASGGFVALLHDGAGKPVSVHAGDLVTVECDGHTTQIAVRGGSVAARAASVTGTAAAGSTVTLSLLKSGAAPAVSVLTTGSQGSFRRTESREVAGGTEVVAGLKDASGNEEAMSDFVPGLAVSENSNLVRGWTAGYKPRLMVRRAGRVLVDSAVPAADDGSFVLPLSRNGRPLAIRAGDVLQIGSRTHHRMITIPRLSIRLGLGGRVQVAGPARQAVSVELSTVAGDSWRRHVSLPVSGRTSIAFPAETIRPGDRATATVLVGREDVLSTTSEATSVELREGSADVSGVMRPGQLATLHILDSRGSLVGAATVVGSQSTGEFSAELRDAAGRLVRIGRGNVIAVGANGTWSSERFPRLRLLAPAPASSVSILAPSGTKLAVGIVRKGRASRSTLHVGAAGRSEVSLGSSPESVDTVTVTWKGRSGISVVRSIHPGHGR